MQRATEKHTRGERRDDNGNGGTEGGHIGKRLLAAYFHSLKHRPLITKCITSSLIGASGNIFTQTVIHGKSIPNVELRNVLAFATSNFISGSLSHFWFIILDRITNTAIFQERIESDSEVSIEVKPLQRLVRAVRFLAVLLKPVIRVVIDQLLFAPTVNSLFFTVMSAYERKLHDLPSRLRRDLLPTLIKNWSVWPIASFINLNFVPQQYRVLFGNMIGFFWSIVLGLQVSRKK